VGELVTRQGLHLARDLAGAAEKEQWDVERENLCGGVSISCHGKDQ
jgi:hypothetical protein